MSLSWSGFPRWFSKLCTCVAKYLETKLYGYFFMLTDQKKSLECSGLGTKGEHRAFFGPANCGRSFILGEGKLDVHTKSGKIVEQQRHHLDFWGDWVVDTTISFLNCWWPKVPHEGCLGCVSLYLSLSFRVVLGSLLLQYDV